MPIITLIARANDGLALLQSGDKYAGLTDEEMHVFKSQGKQILNPMSAKNAPLPSKVSIDAGRCIFHYMREAGIAYLTLTDKAYPKRLAFLYLEEIHTTFTEQLQREYGDSWRHEVETVPRPYAFMRFDRYINRKRRDYSDPSSRQNMKKVEEELADIYNITRKNIQEVLNRGERLDNMNEVSSRIRDKSKSFKWGSKKLRMQAQFQKYAPLAAMGFVVLVVVYFKFF